MLKSLSAIAFVCCIFTMCATAQQKNDSSEHVDISHYAQADASFDKYLVAEDSYTTNGIIYHKKYINYLYGIAKLIKNEHKVEIGERSIGFYYDKRENRKDKLFLGVDIIMPEQLVSPELSYEKNARFFVNKYLRQTMNVLVSCTDILGENEVRGVVTGFVWQRNNVKELINIWIRKDDLSLFYSNQITMTELIVRSTFTNTEGRIIPMTL
jgi:hypothetical protein